MTGHFEKGAWIENPIKGFDIEKLSLVDRIRHLEIENERRFHENTEIVNVLGLLAEKLKELYGGEVNSHK